MRCLLTACVAMAVAGCSEPPDLSQLNDLIPPAVESTVPAPGAPNVTLDATVEVRFSEPVDPTTVTAGSFRLRQGSQVVPGTISVAGAVATLVPEASLLTGMTYTAEVTTAVTDLAGNRLAADHGWSFTVVGLVTP